MDKEQTIGGSNLKIVYVPMIPIIEKNQAIKLDEDKAGQLEITERLQEVGEIVLKAKTHEIIYDDNNIIIERIDKETGRIITSKRRKKKKTKAKSDDFER